MKVAGSRTDSGKADGVGCFPAVLLEVGKVRGKTFCLASPVGKTEEGADSESPEPGGISPFRAFKSPVEIFLWTRGMKLRVSGAIVALLIDNQSFTAGFNHPGIIRGFHRADLKGNRWDEIANCGDAFLQIALRNKPGMLPGDEKNASKAQ